MAVFEVNNLSFRYPKEKNYALKNISFKVEEGETVIVCGLSGSGKSTLLKCLKPALIPFAGELSGEIFFDGTPSKEMSNTEQAAKIGFVMQCPDNQIVTHKVWHEIAFTMENLGLDKKMMRIKAGEMCSYFGLSHLYDRDINTLSGGQKQLINLASVLAADPKVVILDEPASQLDPISAAEFLNVIKRINRELGITIIISEHRLEDVISFADKLLAIDRGQQVFFGGVQEGINIISLKNKELFKSMPLGIKIYDRFSNGSGYPLDVCGSRAFLKKYIGIGENKISANAITQKPDMRKKETAVKCSDIWFKYDKKGSDIIKNLSLEVFKGEIFSVLGANGSGKSTLLKCLCGIEKPYRGRIKTAGGDTTAMLPQDPALMFLKETVIDELYESVNKGRLGITDKDKEKIFEAVEFFKLDELLSMHPYDLSGGEQQKVALAKLLLKNPQIILLDEPTKGLDFSFKEKLKNTIKQLAEIGKTIIMVSHDIDFTAEFSDRCAMLFNGEILSCSNPRDFFQKNRFYTTNASRIGRGIIPDAVFADDILKTLEGIR